MKQLQAEEQGQLETICREVELVALYAHGSQVTGRAHPESDYDFAFLLRHGASSDKAMDELLPGLARIYRLPEADVDLQDLRQAPPSFRWQTMESGRLLFCLDTYELARFHAATISEERDREYFLKPIRAAMHSRIRAGRFAS